MNRLAAIALLLAATMLGASASPRIAVVRVTEIYSGLESTANLTQQIQKERDSIPTDDRATKLRRVIDELKALQVRLADKNTLADEKSASELERAYEALRQEEKILRREYEEFRTAREKQINRKMVTAMRASLDRIHETARRIAAGQGFDLLFDSSGNTNTGAPFILYQKEAPDLTAAVKAALQEVGEGDAGDAPPTPSNP